MNRRAMSQVRCFTGVISPTSPTCNDIYNIFDIARHCGVYFERFVGWIYIDIYLYIYQWIFLQTCVLVGDIMKMCMRYLM